MSKPEKVATKKKPTALFSSDSEDDMGAGKVDAKAFATAGANVKSALKKPSAAAAKKPKANLFGGESDEDSDDVAGLVAARPARANAPKTLTKKKAVAWGDDDSADEKPVVAKPSMARRPTGGLGLKNKLMAASDDDSDEDGFDFNFKDKKKEEPKKVDAGKFATAQAKSKAGGLFGGDESSSSDGGFQAKKKAPTPAPKKVEPVKKKAAAWDDDSDSDENPVIVKPKAKPVE